MAAIMKGIELLRQYDLLKIALILGSVWLFLNLTCWILGAAGLYAAGRRKGETRFFPAFIPGGQIWYTLRLAGENRLAGWAEIFLWWCPTCAVAGVTAAVWGAVRYLDNGSLLLLGLAAVLFAAALILYVLCRYLELKGLLRLLPRSAWWISLVGTILGIPVQRVFLFAGRGILAQE